ncbi:MAG: hypothetical protein U0175_31525 [Caldilineaceae bacterium]
MHRLPRSTALKIAAILSFVVGVYGFVLFMPLMARGDAALRQAEGWLPYYVVILVFVQSTIRMSTAYLVWHGWRAGILWTLFADLLDIADAVPGMLFAPTFSLRLGSILTTLCSIVVIILCLWRQRLPSQETFKRF